MFVDLRERWLPKKQTTSFTNGG